MSDKAKIYEVWFSTEAATDADFGRHMRLLALEPEFAKAAERRRRWPWSPSWLRFWPFWESRRTVQQRVAAVWRKADESETETVYHEYRP